MDKVKLYYITNSGDEWFDKMVEVNLFNYKSVIDEYVDKHQVPSDKLLEHWRRDGENVLLFLECDNDSVTVGFFRMITEYIDSTY